MRELPAATAYDGFRVTAAENGGFILSLDDNKGPGYQLKFEAAFTDAEDMIEWIARELSVTVVVTR
ncbi:hypothetical protein [Mesorhizobium sp. M7A.F.Ca.CA.004.02.1.1]|uniref:hypothetical protein n=1 Tax=Mesorhizobium sp. M7A.F.Ca.CA.004.02.1.1 TaxID=2496690 RepID=UPI000FCA731F|nr:hypothetical protein [Mesorhizobium sp. M7A.F.Ca.CA.004.02.1.1]RVB02846.1 hypothetical protein EN912_10365 [Mesorhizobium sp. M7A.F.Ca.CA.004.02.1.1]